MQPRLIAAEIESSTSGRDGSGLRLVDDPKTLQIHPVLIQGRIVMSSLSRTHIGLLKELLLFIE